jgi:HEAT repeat protein
MGDADETVRLAALRSAAHIHVFTGVDAIAALSGDPSAAVRRHAAQTLGTMRVADAVVPLIALATQDSDSGVRAAAVWALGKIGDAAARDAIVAAKDDQDSFVRDAANIADRLL